MNTGCVRVCARRFGGCSTMFYELKPIQLGCEARGLDLKEDVPQQAIEQLKKDIAEHRLIVFKDQGIVSGKRHVEISKWFGPLDSTFYQHPKSPDPDVFRVSNDPTEGCTGVGRTGWHIDGSFQPAPFSYSLYHMVSIPNSGGETVFAPLTDIIEGLSEEKLALWERLWMVSDRRSGPVHPMIYSHPITKKKVLCFHLGMTEGYILDYSTSKARRMTLEETIQVKEDIHHEFVKNDEAIQYAHKWQPGDFIFSDNLAVGHEASPSTQFDREEVGLRVLHRTTVKGHYPPRKEYKLL